ncbi:hypothetical protein [Candidatus Scalindua japonica]|uniref:hypothetical protein n=1 Tax=Candidatus Scalindua japonica TaxID=1284222 RepID=UPI001054FEAA|nr:hypothetical protein [Candidatus Scalindua japonica]
MAKLMTMENTKNRQDDRKNRREKERQKNINHGDTMHAGKWILVAGNRCVGSENVSFFLH